MAAVGTLTLTFADRAAADDDARAMCEAAGQIGTARPAELVNTLKG